MNPAWPRRTVTISVISHNQGVLVSGLAEDLARNCDPEKIGLVLTMNTEEPCPISREELPYPTLIVRNGSPKGFGANHNAAFRHANGDYFCVINPDIRFSGDPFEPLCRRLSEPGTGVVAPLVVDPEGIPQDSARRILTPGRLVGRMLRGPNRMEYDRFDGIFEPDWLAGMFLVFPARVFRESGGFDERYFLYCEDMDLCLRIRLSGFRVVQDTGVRVVHEARRESHSGFRHAYWHLSSLTHFFRSKTYRDCSRLR